MANVKISALTDAATVGLTDEFPIVQSATTKRATIAEAKLAIDTGAAITTANAMGALAIDVTKALNTKTIAADSTLTFSGTPATADTWFALYLINSDTNPHVITFPSSFSVDRQATVTTYVIGASGQSYLSWRYDGTNYKLFGDGGFLNNFAGTAAPTVNEDLADGYGAGSIWLDATNNNTYICESAGAGAAVWHQLNRGEAVSFTVAVSDETTALTTGTAKLTFRMPFAMTLTAIRGSVGTAATGGTLLTVDVNEGAGAGTTILSTKLTFDASEFTTTTAATPAVISDSALADDAQITIDIDAVGSTIAGAGLKVTFIGIRA